ncbi:MAG: type IV secretory system conjugative DNA transfer family protein [Gammaproteobacteria bacterium]|nr:type IV secretory system conjugative DNA transfer family protein [Gammaproteobacteria bacterium]
MTEPALPRGTTVHKNPAIASSRWATQKDIEASPDIMLARHIEEIAARAALFLGQAPDGRFVGHADDRHCLTVAGSRAGKGTGLIIPNLLLYPGSILCLDPKGENARLTAERRRRMGQAVYVLDPFGVSGENCAAYNPLGDLEPESDTLIDDAAVIADCMISDRSARDPHWNETARELMKGLILHVKLDRPFEDQQTLIEMRRILRDPMLLGTALQQMTEPAGVSDAHAVMAAVAAAYLGKPDRERESVLSTARRHTEFLDSPGLERVLGAPEGGQQVLGSLRRLRDAYRSPEGRPVTVYLCLPATRMTTHARWLRLIVGLGLALFEQDAQAHPASLRSGRPQVLFLLDEFASLEHMPALSLAAGLMAGYGLKLWPFLQDLSQIKTHYQSSWETFIGNAGAHLFFGNTDTTTLNYVSERLGKVRITRGSMSRQNSGTLPREGSGVGYNVSDDVTPLLSPDEIQRIFARDKRTGGFIAALLPGALPIWLRKVEWHAHPALRALLDGHAPPEPEPEKPRGWWRK